METKDGTERLKANDGFRLGWCGPGLLVPISIQGGGSNKGVVTSLRAFSVQKTGSYVAMAALLLPPAVSKVGQDILQLVSHKTGATCTNK